MIRVDNLTKRYGPVLAVDGITFHVERGGVVGILGPNGAGKSTTLRILTCYQPATNGSAAVAGFEKVSAGLKTGSVKGLARSVLLQAADAASDSMRKMRALSGGVPVVGVLRGDELADAFGRERTVHVLITEGRLAQAVRLTATKLAGFRGSDAEDTAKN